MEKIHKKYCQKLLSIYEITNVFKFCIAKLGRKGYIKGTKTIKYVI